MRRTSVQPINNNYIAFCSPDHNLEINYSGNDDERPTCSVTLGRQFDFTAFFYFWLRFLPIHALHRLRHLAVDEKPKSQINHRIPPVIPCFHNLNNAPTVEIQSSHDPLWNRWCHLHPKIFVFFLCILPIFTPSPLALEGSSTLRPSGGQLIFTGWPLTTQTEIEIESNSIFRYFSEC